jgi:hypothetical protein
MPRATSPPLRQRLFDLHQEGLAIKDIAQQLALPQRTIRCLLAQWRHLPDCHDLKPLTDHCGRKVSQERLPVQQAALQLRRDHPGWGGGRIRLELLDLYPSRLVPATRTLQRWLDQAKLIPPPLVRPAAVDHRRAQEPHEVWQMDAVEGLRLADGSGACWLRQTDECSGAILATELFPPLPLCDRASGPGAAGAKKLL